MKGHSLLIVCPDYASHFYPLSAMASAWQARGRQVTVATGPGLGSMVRGLGFAYAPLVLGPGHNSGLLRTEAQRVEEAEHMRAFFRATAAGPAPTLAHQARARRHDMLHDPAGVHAQLDRILAETRPDVIVTDQLSYSATLALHALGVPFISFHPGNPQQAQPTEGRPFGLPRRFPDCLDVAGQDVDELRALCVLVEQEFTAAFNAALSTVNSAAAPVPSAFRFTSRRRLLLNYSAALAAPYRQHLPSTAQFLGSCVRREPLDDTFDAALGRLRLDRPTIYVSFGTFLSARSDCLSRVAAALRLLPVNVIMASGVTLPAALGPAPDHWVILPTVPQIAALRRADLVISHGGNNTLTEALTLGVAPLVGPMSSDQFDNAADLEDAGLGSVFAPNTMTAEDLATQVERALGNRALRERVHALSRELGECPGPERAIDLLES